MKALAYLLKTSIINYFKRLKEKPQKAIGPIFVAIWLGFMFIPKRSSIGEGAPLYIFVSLFVSFILVVFLYSLYVGSKKVDSKFDMSDVNLIFVSPIRPQTVMLYGIIKKIAVELLASLYLVYQVPNILRGYRVSGTAEVMLIVSYFTFQLIFCNVLKLLIFALSTKFKGLGTIIRNFIRVLLLLSAAGIALLIINDRFLEFFENLFNSITYSSWFKYVPLFGWMREIAFQTVTGMKLSYLIYVSLILLTSGLLLYITYSMELDFYEDMLSSAENNEMVREIKSGKMKKRENGKQPPFMKPFKFKKNVLKLKGRFGAEVLFFKHMNEYFKRSIIFFINTYSLILLAVSVLLGLYAKNADIKFIFYIASGLLFFSSGLGGKIYSEIDHYFIFLMPDTAQKKLFYGISSSLVKISTDAALLFLPFGILSRSSMVEVLLCMLCYIAIGGMLSYSGLFGFRIAQLLGFTGVIAQGLLFMFFQLFLAVPAIIIIVAVSLTLSTFNLAVYAAILIYCVSIALLISLGCVGMFNDMEFRE